MIEKWGLEGVRQALLADYQDSGRRVYFREKQKYSFESIPPVLEREETVLVFPLFDGTLSCWWLDFEFDPRYNKSMMYINRGTVPLDYRSITHSWSVTAETWMKRDDQKIKKEETAHYHLSAWN